MTRSIGEKLRSYKRTPGSFILMLLVMLSAIITFAVLLFLIAYILINGIPHIKPELFALKYTSENGSLFPALINTIIMTALSLIIAVPFAMNYAGGWSSISANIPEGTMNLFEGYDLFGIISLVIMYTATFSVGQEAVSRFYAAKDEKAAKGGAWLAALVNFIYAFIPTILGIITLALINMGKFSSEQFASVGARYALPVLAINTMPALICGLLFAGIISATMSSSDSDLLGAGSIFANDIYKAVFKTGCVQ